MRFVILMCMVGVSMGQMLGGYTIKEIVDVSFGHMDVNPADASISQNEFDAFLTQGDTNRDGCVTVQEYEATHTDLPTDISSSVFNHFDADKDGCLKYSDMQYEYHAVDKNGDLSVNLAEFESYMIDMLIEIIASAAIAAIGK